MESLGSIFEAILKNRKILSRNDSNVLERSEPDCPKCDDTGAYLFRTAGREKIFRQCECTLQSLEDKLLRRASLPSQKEIRTIESFKVTPGTRDALNATKAMITGEFGWNILLLVGSYGLGKTHLLEALGREVVAKRIVVKYLFQPDWVDSLRDAASFDTETQASTIWDVVDRSELILLDDLTDRRVTPFAIEQVERLVDDRYRNGGLLVATTNLPFKEFAGVWGPRLADRLFEGDSDIVRYVTMSGPSYRTGEEWEN